ncbi:MAG: hypothetical protein R3C19_10195 [Planctomycetaceae bacterium]
MADQKLVTAQLLEEAEYEVRREYNSMKNTQPPRTSAEKVNFLAAMTLGPAALVLAVGMCWQTADNYIAEKKAQINAYSENVRSQQEQAIADAQAAVAEAQLRNQMLVDKIRQSHQGLHGSR